MPDPENKSTNIGELNCSTSILAILPPWLRHHLRSLQRELGGELYLAGGVVRDLLLGKRPQDIDLAVAHQAQV